MSELRPTPSELVEGVQLSSCHKDAPEGSAMSSPVSELDQMAELDSDETVVAVVALHSEHCHRELAAYFTRVIARILGELVPPTDQESDGARRDRLDALHQSLTASYRDFFVSPGVLQEETDLTADEFEEYEKTRVEMDEILMDLHGSRTIQDTEKLSKLLQATATSAICTYLSQLERNWTTSKGLPSESESLTRLHDLRTLARAVLSELGTLFTAADEPPTVPLYMGGLFSIVAQYAALTGQPEVLDDFMQRSQQARSNRDSLEIFSQCLGGFLAYDVTDEEPLRKAILEHRASLTGEQIVKLTAELYEANRVMEIINVLMQSQPRVEAAFSSQSLGQQLERIDGQPAATLLKDLRVMNHADTSR